MAIRVLLGAMLIAGTYLGVLYIRHLRQPDEVRPPQVDIANLPRQFGAWTGTDTQIDPRLAPVLGAMKTVDRIYQDGMGGQVATEVAVFLEKEGSEPHPPQVCYTRVGWSIVEEKNLDLQVGDHTRVARLLTLELDRQRVHVLYWYQLGEGNFVDFEGLREERRKLFGKKVWPPIVKVMMQSNLSNSTQAEEQLRRLGERMLAWTQTVQ